MVNKKLKNWLGPLTLSLILVIIFTANFTPDTYLIGWDNLMPELNIWMNLKRSLFAVWQEYQGLGLVSGMGHATDLIRQVILLPFVLIIPNNWIRYLWTFGMLALGTFGVYFGVKRFHNTSEESVPDTVRGVIPIIASLSYLLNFGTIQIFWVPFEAFTTFWGFFPWLIFSFLTILKKPNKKNWIKFIIWNILAIPGFYIQTLFVVYGLCLTVIWIFSLRNTVRGAVRRHLGGVIPFIIVLAINAFWLLPFGYFLLTNAHHPREALINRMSTEETFLRNQKRGYLSDFLTLKGYYYDFPDAGQPLMTVWQNHFSSTPIKIIGYVFGAIVILGLIKAPNWLRGIFLLSVVTLLSATPPFTWLNSFLRQWPFIDQVFRSPFTKFIVPASFSFGMLFSYGINLIISRFKFKKIILSITLLGLIIYSWPVFNGNLIYSKMRRQIPEKYLQLIDYFKAQPKTGRIANLPQGNFWGWTFYRFGTRGSGFIWYGIEQPITDRAFDVWNLKNERYYQELTYALQNQDLDLLESIFNKYSIEYVVFDDEVIFPENKNWAKLALNTKKLLDQIDFLEHEETFDNIFIYKVKNSQTKPFMTDNQNYYTALDQIPDYQLREKPNFKPPVNEEINFDQLEKVDEFNLGPEDFINPHICAPTTEKSKIDYQTEGNQMILTAKQTALCLQWKEYKYFQQFNSPKLINIQFEYQSNSNEWPRFCLWDITNLECVNRKDFPKQGFSQEWNTYSETLIFNPDNQTITNLSLIVDAYQKENKEIKYRNVNLEIYQAPPGSKLPMTVENPIEKNLVRVEAQTCNDYQQGEYNLEFKPNEYLRLSSVNNNSCYTWAFNHLPLNQSWQVKIKYRNVQGYPLTLAASSLDGQYQIYQNLLTDDKNWQTKYFLLPPYNTYQKGIQIQLNNNSFNFQESINDIGSIEIYPADIKYPTPPPPTEKFYLDSKSNIWWYKVKVSAKGGWAAGPNSDYLVLPQSYDSGWTAFYFDGWQPKFLKDQVLINNWANGWDLNSSIINHQSLFIIFWPQLLQFAGFGLLAGTIVYINIKWPKKINSSP